MRKILFILITILFNSSIKAQDIELFKKDLRALYNNDFQNVEIERFFKDHNKLLFNYLENLHKVDSTIDVKDVIHFPLVQLNEDELYHNVLNTLQKDTTKHKTQLACALILAANDTSNLEYVKSLVNTHKINYIYAAATHILLAPKDVNTILNYLLANKNNYSYFHHLFDLFYLLDKNVIENFAYQNINNTDELIRHLAINSLKYQSLTTKKDSTIRELIRTSDLNWKGLTIDLLIYFKLPNVKNIVSPYLTLDTLNLELSAIHALIASPSNEDHSCLFQHLLSKDSINRELNDLLNSNNHNIIKNTLKILLKKPVANNTYFEIKDNSLLYKNQYLEDVRKTIKTINNKDIKTEFIRLLYNRFDQKSTELLISLLYDRENWIHWEAARALENNPSTEIKETIISLATDANSPNLVLVDYLIKNNVDNLQDFYIQVYTNKDSLYSIYECEKAFLYLTTFPKNEHKHLFIEMLKKKDHILFAQNRQAAQALGKLQAVEAIELIIEHLQQEREGSDSNCIEYIKALASLKTPKSFDIISSFKSSQDEYVAKEVKEILDNW